MSIIKKITQIVIYEDAGNVKTAHCPSITSDFVLNKIPNWIDILIAAEHNDDLNKLLEQVEILYFLSKKDDV